MAFEMPCDQISPLSHSHLTHSAPATWPLKILNMPSFRTTGPLHKLNPLAGSLSLLQASVQIISSEAIADHSAQDSIPIHTPPLVTFTNILSFTNRAFITISNYVLECLFVCLLVREDICCVCLPTLPSSEKSQSLIACGSSLTASHRPSPLPSQCMLAPGMEA